MLKIFWNTGGFEDLMKKEKLRNYEELKNINGILQDYWFFDDEAMKPLNGEISNMNELKGCVDIVEKYKDQYAVEIIVGILVNVVGVESFEQANDILEHETFTYLKYDNQEFNRDMEIAHEYLESYVYHHTPKEAIPNILLNHIDYSGVVAELQTMGWVIAEGYIINVH